VVSLSTVCQFGFDAMRRRIKPDDFVIGDKAS
jgi:hypothetical protein